MSTNLRSRAKSAKAQINSPKAPTTPNDPSPSPGENAEEKAKCAICLGDLVNRSYSNNCCHQFCFGCLLEWSKVKPECPLCKSSFTSIYHNVRPNNDCDEYHVPPQTSPISMLNVPTYLHHIYDQDIMLRSHRFHPYGHSSIQPTLSFHHPHHTYRNRAQFNFRILEYVPFERRAEQPNPFRGQTEYFGTSIGLHNNDPMSSSSIPNYQARRRIYDRNQWVIPLGRTLPEGSVMFPSVEYIQTHPTARSRITTWLHRELTVLLGLQMSMQDMATVFDVIMNVLENYDIRSREFRELVVSYFGYKTRHFQHEFYHFVLSGMGLEEYDRNACYASNRPNSSNDPHDLSVPPIVTIGDSSDDDTHSGPRNDNECIVITNNDDTNSSTGTTTSVTNVAPSTAPQMPDLPWDLTIGSTMNELQSVLLDRQFCQQLSTALTTSDHRRCYRDRYRRHYDALERPPRERRLLASDRNDQEQSEVDSYSRGRFRPFRIGRTSTDHVEQHAATDEGVNVDTVSNSGFQNADEPPTNDDDCVLLGVHPVVKKPPLAVITISDSEEETASTTTKSKQPGCKNEVIDNPEVQVPDQFLDMCYSSQPQAGLAGVSEGADGRTTASSSRSPSSAHGFRSPLPTYFFDPVSTNSNSEASQVTQGPSGSRRLASTVHPTTSKRLRLLDSKKPKSSKHKKSTGKSSGSRKRRGSNGASKKKRNRSPSSSSEAEWTSRSRKLSSKKSKKKKSRRAPSSSSSSYSDESSSESSSTSSDCMSSWKRLKHMKTSSNKTSNNDIPKLKLRKNHKSKKKSSKSSSKKYLCRPKKAMSREYISTTDSSDTNEEDTPADKRLFTSDVVSTRNVLRSGNSSSASSSTTVAHVSLGQPSPTLSSTSYQNVMISPEGLRGDHQGYCEIMDSPNYGGLEEEIGNLMEGAGDRNNPEETLTIAPNLSSPNEDRGDRYEWRMLRLPSTPPPPYLLNLSLSRMSDDFWS